MSGQQLEGLAQPAKFFAERERIRSSERQFDGCAFQRYCVANIEPAVEIHKRKELTVILYFLSTVCHS